MAVTTVFTNNRTQAVRLPSEARLPEGVKKVIVRVKGHERIIAPVSEVALVAASHTQVQDFLASRLPEIGHVLDYLKDK